MATYYRQTGVLTGQAITLYAIYTDETGQLVDADSDPVIYIYDSDVETETISDEVDAATYASALSGPLASTRISTGYYKYTYTVPSGADAGYWYDVWVADIDTVDASDILSFKVSQSASVSTQNIGTNTMLVIELDASVAASSDSTVTLGEDQTLYFTTTYDPLYASPDMVRMEIGRWIEDIPDNTLAMMAYWSSKEADFLHGAQAKNQANLKFAKSRYVIYDSVLKCLMLPGGGASSASVAAASGGKKQLGDLMINNGSSSSGVPVVDDDLVNWFREQRAEWLRVVNAGGNIVPGGGFAPAYASKGKYDPNRPMGGRLWEDPNQFHYWQPTTNRKTRRQGHRQGRWGFYYTPNKWKP